MILFRRDINADRQHAQNCASLFAWVVIKEDNRESVAFTSVFVSVVLKSKASTPPEN